MRTFFLFILMLFAHTLYAQMDYSSYQNGVELFDKGKCCLAWDTLRVFEKNFHDKTKLPSNINELLDKAETCCKKKLVNVKLSIKDDDKKRLERDGKNPDEILKSIKEGINDKDNSYEIILRYSDEKLTFYVEEDGNIKEQRSVNVNLSPKEFIQVVNDLIADADRKDSCKDDINFVKAAISLLEKDFFDIKDTVDIDKVKLVREFYMENIIKKNDCIKKLLESEYNHHIIQFLFICITIDEYEFKNASNLDKINFIPNIIGNYENLKSKDKINIKKYDDKIKKWETEKNRLERIYVKTNN